VEGIEERWKELRLDTCSACTSRKLPIHTVRVQSLGFKPLTHGLNDRPQCGGRPKNRPKIFKGNKSQKHKMTHIKYYSAGGSSQFARTSVYSDFAYWYRCYRSVVCLFVTFVHCAQTAEDIDTISLSTPCCFKRRRHSTVNCGRMARNSAMVTMVTMESL